MAAATDGPDVGVLALHGVTRPLAVHATTERRARESRRRSCRRAASVGLLILAVALGSARLQGEPVVVRYPEGSLHGFLSLRAPDGSLLANGDLIQVAHGQEVTSQLVFRFKDGSLHDDTAVFSQRGRFRLLREHLLQSGPSFPRKVDMKVDALKGRVQVSYIDEHGDPKTIDEQLKLPDDLSNGLIPVLLKNARLDRLPRTFSLVVATPKPRLVRLGIAATGRESFRTDTERREAEHFVLKVEIGGVAGWLAPLVGKQPPDSHVWILEGRAPAFVRAEQPFYMGGPLWRIDLIGPRW